MTEEEDKEKIHNTLIAEAIEEGYSKGIEEEKKNSENKTIEIAKNFLSMNIPIEDVSKATGLSIEELKKL